MTFDIKVADRLLLGREGGLLGGCYCSHYRGGHSRLVTMEETSMSKSAQHLNREPKGSADNVYRHGIWTLVFQESSCRWAISTQTKAGSGVPLHPRLH